MAKAITGKEAMIIIEQSLVGSGSGVTSAEVTTEGTDLNLLAAAFAACTEALSSQLVKIKQSMSIMTAVGEELDDIAYSYYGLARKDSSPSIGSLRLTRATFAYGAFTFNKFSRVSTADGTEFETLEDASFGATDLTVDVLAKSTLSGSKYNVNSTGLITKFITRPLDRTLTVTNNTIFAGGDDEWKDEQFKTEILNHASSLSKGTLKAIETGAKLVLGVTNAKAENVMEVVDGFSIPNGSVELVISDPDGLANTSITALFPAALEEWAPAGVYVKAITGTREYTDISITVTYTNTNMPTYVKKDLIKKAILAYVNSRKADESIDPFNIVSSALSVSGVAMYGTGVVEPVGVLYPGSSGATFKTTMERILVNGS